ncbi:hypothetical protein PoHVEF18_009228 [Penicillium ochrochloron]
MYWSPQTGFKDKPSAFIPDDTGFNEEWIDHHIYGLHKAEPCDKSENPGPGDFCMWKNREAYSSRCMRKHGRDYVALLLTSRATYDEAIRVFYAKSRIVIMPHISASNCVFGSATRPLIEGHLCTDGAGHLPREYIRPIHVAQGDATKSFMERVGPKALRLIRTLEIVFPVIGMESNYLEDGLAFRNWPVTVKYLKELMSTQNLTLVVHIRTPRHGYNWSFEHALHILEIDAPLLLKPLVTPPRMQLARLFVHLESSYHLAPSKLLPDIEAGGEQPSGRPPGIPLSNDKLAEMEVALEKMVMGMIVTRLERGMKYQASGSETSGH